MNSLIAKIESNKDWNHVHARQVGKVTNQTSLLMNDDEQLDKRSATKTLINSFKILQQFFQKLVIMIRHKTCPNDLDNLIACHILKIHNMS